MQADVAISKTWLKKILDGDHQFWRMFLDRAEGPLNHHDPLAMVVPELTDAKISPDMAERMMAAAVPDVMPHFEDDPLPPGTDDETPTL